jgi:hypothetical protein
VQDSSKNDVYREPFAPDVSQSEKSRSDFTDR